LMAIVGRRFERFADPWDHLNEDGNA
jgi:hypothetical protein